MATKKLPKIKSITHVDILKKNPEIRAILSAPKNLKKQFVQPFKDLKDFKAVKRTIAEEFPILHVFMKRKKKKKPKDKAEKKKKYKNPAKEILKELKLIAKAIGSKKGEGYKSEEPGEKEPGDKASEEVVGSKKEEEQKQTGMSPWLMGLLAVGAVSIFSSNKKTEAAPVKPRDPTPVPPVQETAPEQEQQAAPETDKAAADLKKIADDNSDLPDILGKEKDKTDKASNDFETKSGKKISKKEEPVLEAKPAATLAPTPEAKPAPAATPKQQEEVPANAVKTGTGGVLTDSSGAPVTSGEPAAAAPATVPPTPIPKQEVKPAPAPKPEVKPAPASKPEAKTEPKPDAKVEQKASSSGKFSSAKDFYAALSPYAKKVSNALGGKVPPSAFLGQWAGESGSGASLPSDFNYAGIKAFGKFKKGGYVLTEERYNNKQLERAKQSGETLERILGKDDKMKKGSRQVTVDEWYGKGSWQKAQDEGLNWVQVKSYFAKFDSLDDFAEGFISFLKSPRYSKALTSTSAADYGKQIAEAGYATASSDKYSAKVAALSSGYIENSGTQLAEASTNVQSKKTDDNTKLATSTVIIKNKTTVVS